MLMRSFKVGDVVQLKSGGPKMTVVLVGGGSDSQHRLIECRWFTSEMRPERAAFPEEALALPLAGIEAAEIVRRLSR
jgi:uncharacterized protein YodC (DUF2158 family)